MGEAEMMMGFVAGVIIGVLALVAGRVVPMGAMRRVLSHGLAVVALWLATMAERLTDSKPAALDLKRMPGPAVQGVALWDGQDWRLMELSLN